KKLGFSNFSAALEGTSEVALAIISSTATTLVVFLPLMLMNEDAEFKFFMTRLGIPVCVSLVASLFVAMLFVPLGTLYLGNSAKFSSTKKPSSRLNLFGEWLFRWIIEHRFDSLILLIILLSTTYYPFSKLVSSNERDNEGRRLSINVKLPKHFDLFKTNDVFLQLEQILFDHKEELEITYILSRFGDREGRLRLFLKEIAESKISVKEITATIKKLLPKLPGVEIQINWESESKDPTIDVTLIGPDTQTLEKIAGAVKERLRLIPELQNIDSAQEEKADELHIHLNRETAFDLEIAPTIVTSTLSYGLRGLQLPSFKGQDREIPILIQYEEEEISPVRLDSLMVYSKKGIELPLASFSKIEVTQAPSEIHRENHKTSLKVTAVPTEGSLDKLREKIEYVLSGIELPRGYSVDRGERFRKDDQNNQALMFTFLMSVVFVFLLMGILFESFVLPVSILTSIPFALFGTAWMLYLTETPFEVMSGIGLVILAGVVVNNAIVLVDCINRLRHTGMGRTDAIVQSSIQRLRPILITALTTVVGLIPMAIGQSNIVGVPYYPLGRTVIGGLTASTILTILVVPLFYTFCDDFRFYGIRIFSKIFGKKA
ncbi:MAG: efflux RND transporter permease subunit, partial [Planctomycetota bacterium]